MLQARATSTRVRSPLRCDTATPVAVETMLEAAREYLKRGYRPIPLHTAIGGHCSCSKADCPKPGKHPRLATWVQYQTHAPTAAEIEATIQAEAPEPEILEHCQRAVHVAMERGKGKTAPAGR